MSVATDGAFDWDGTGEGSDTGATVFDYAWSYEDRDAIHLSRWRLQGVSTVADINVDADGRLWLQIGKAGDNCVGGLHTDSACEAGSKVAALTTTDVSGIADGPIKIPFVAANASGLSGEFWIEAWDFTTQNGVEVIVSLCMDVHLDDEMDDLTALPTYDATAGMARWCAAAMQRIMLSVASMYAEQLGGYGAPEHRNKTGATRLHPDFRRIANPDQLRLLAVHRAMALAMGAAHQRAGDTMFSAARDYHEGQAAEMMQALRLTINTDPDSDDDADGARSAAVVLPTRI